MVNRIRPACRKCGSKMRPVFAHGKRGKAFVRLKDVFTCNDDGTLAKGRRKVTYL